MPLQNVLADTTSSLRILVHIPAPSQRHGAAHPQVESSGLAELVGWGTYYPLGDRVAPDASDRYINFDKLCQRKLGQLSQTVFGNNAINYDAIQITNFKERCWETIVVNSFSNELKWYADKPGYEEYLQTTANGVEFTAEFLGMEDEIELILVRPKMIAMMSSAILCTKPGQGTIFVFIYVRIQVYVS